MVALLWLCMCTLSDCSVCPCTAVDNSISWLCCSCFDVVCSVTAQHTCKSCMAVYVTPAIVTAADAAVMNSCWFLTNSEPANLETASALQEALKGLPWLPTLDCLALSPDPAIRARAAAALAALATAGQLESQDAQIRWRDMLLGWLAASTAHLLAAPSSSSGSSSDDSSRAAWLWSWFKDEGGAEDGTRAKGAVCETNAANEALARSCVVALRGEAGQRQVVADTGGNSRQCHC